MKNFNKKQTKKFINLWNKANGFPYGEDTLEGNMRYYKAGKVTWNSYDTPVIDLNEFNTFFNKLF